MWIGGVSGKAGHGHELRRELGHRLKYFFGMLTRFGKFYIALALYCYFTVFIDPCCVAKWILALILMEALAGVKESTVMARGRHRQKL